MSAENKLVKKIKRRERRVVEAKKDQYKIDKFEETLQKSPRAQSLMRKPQRRMDASFGYNTVTGEQLAWKGKATLARFDFDPGAGTDFGLRLTFAAGLVAASGVQPGDIAVIEQDGSQAENRYLTVISIPDSTHVRLDDMATFSGTETNVTVRFILSGVKKSYT